MFLTGEEQAKCYCGRIYVGVDCGKCVCMSGKIADTQVLLQQEADWIVPSIHIVVTGWMVPSFHIVVTGWYRPERPFPPA